MGQITENVMIHCLLMIGFLAKNGENKAPAVLNRLDIAKLNEVMPICLQFIKCVEGDFLSYFETFPILEKFMANLEPLRSKGYTEHLMQAVSKCIS
jgi:hypothetical protein